MCHGANGCTLPNCSLGVKNADENELRSIASDPDSIHMYNVADFSFLLDIVDNLTDNLCNSVKGPGTNEFIKVCTQLTDQSKGITEEQYTGLHGQTPSTLPKKKKLHFQTFQKQYKHSV